MTDLVETIRSEMEQPDSAAPRNAILVHIYPAGPEMGVRYVLGKAPVEIGRGEGCTVRINDGSVSRRHARLEPSADGYSVTDLGSMNGTLVNDLAVSSCPLQDGDYLRVGNCIYRFLTGGNVEAQYHQEIYRLTISDALTQTFNKRYLLEALDRELVRARRFGRPLALVLFDIDHFKKVNDERGHLAGDATLRELAARVKTAVRQEEVFARYGGEEFAVLLPESTAQDGVTLAERVRLLVAGQPFEFDDERYPVTVSLGVAGTQQDKAYGTQELLRDADAALYRAKEAGRNCVRLAPGPEAAGAPRPAAENAVDNG